MYSPHTGFVDFRPLSILAVRVKHYMGTTEPVKMNSLSTERVHIAKIFKVHIEKAIFEDLITGYEVTLQGRLDTTPIRIEIEASSSEKEIP